MTFAYSLSAHARSSASLRATTDRSRSIFAGAVSSGLAYIFYFQAIAALGASRAAALLFLVPLVSLLGDLMLGELPHAMALLSGLLALAGVALIQRTVPK